MTSKSSKVLVFLLMSSVLLVALDADSEDCTTELNVWRNTVYEAFPGQELRIDCPAVLCNNLPPTVNWYKIEEKITRLSINGSDRIKIGWEKRKPLEGSSYLIFQNFNESDAGRYQCESGGSVSHTINITVNENMVALDVFWNYMYYVVGIGAFLIIGIFICVISQKVLKGRCRRTADLCHRSSDEIYANITPVCRNK